MKITTVLQPRLKPERLAQVLSFQPRAITQEGVFQSDPTIYKQCKCTACPGKKT